MTSLILPPADLLTPQGFDDGMLCQATCAAIRPGIGVVMLTARGLVSTYPKWSNYIASRHLLRHVVREHLLPLFPWASEMVSYHEPDGSPVRLWLYDSEGCPLRSREQEVRDARPVRLGFDELRRAVDAVYPLTTPAQIRLYDALALPPGEHEKVLALVAPFCDLEDDVLVLAAELYAGARAGKLAGTPSVAAVPGDSTQRNSILEVADRLFDAVASARSLVG